MTEARLAHEVWQVIKDEDWVLTANTLKEWVHKIWDFDKPYRHVGRELGTGTQIGMSIGVALAHKGTGKSHHRSAARRRFDVRSRRAMDADQV